ncbi:HtaA domain-containing protein [Oerskovia merdavium]|uniref:HtaA domain-containing protein n=1 Tax=Oerskovia merdavium TaxID=2762227 RepID=A0ABR8U2V5_9CELL|nr:HtaA domain-containing protein [Oerskovia merdavium]MBD7982368.1 HtaA domain-containing protein [Oerskovia merdavium]
MLITQRGGRRRALASLLTGALVAGLAVVGVTPASAADTVTVSGGSATWNLKDSWTGYVGGAGTITPALTNGKSVYSPASGSIDPVTGVGALRFGGSTNYKAHGGVLDITVADLRLAISSPTTGVLTADVTTAAGLADDVKVADVAVSTARAGDTLTVTANGALSSAFGALDGNFSDYVGQPMSTFTATLDAPLPVAPAAPTTTTLAVAPVGTSVEGTAVALSATVAPAAAGSVEFLDGATSLGTATVSDGAARLDVAAPAVGEHAYSARFTPADAAAFVASTSASTAHTVTAKTVDPPAPVADPKVTVTPSADVDPAVENTFTISGTGFVGAGAKNGAYVLLGESSIWKGEGPLLAEGWLQQVYVRSIVDGAFTTTITVPAGSFDATKEYVVATSAAHALSVTDRSLDTFTPVTFKGEEPTAPVFEPAIEVFAADGVTPLGDTLVGPGDAIVVKGSGFDPAANVGGRGAPIPANLPQGTYVVFGSFADEWQPSTGAPTTARKVGPQAWALAESVLDQVPPAFQGTIRKQWVDIAEDGSFTATLTLAELEAIEGGSFGVYTYAAGGVKNAAQELAYPVSFTNDPAPVFEPAIEVFAADGVTPLGDTVVRPGDAIVVKGSGFDPASNVGGYGNPIPNTLPQGNYVVFGSFAEAWRPSEGVASSARKVGSQAWALSETVLNQLSPANQSIIRGQWADIAADGTFTAKLTLKAPAALEGGRYGVYTYGAGGVKNADQELSVPVSFTETPAPLTVTPGSSSIEPGDKLTLTVAGLATGDKVSSVLLGDESASFVVNGDSVVVTVPTDQTSGDLTVTVTSVLGATGTATVTVVGKPVVPVADPKVTVTPSADLDPAVENTFTISGTGFVGAGAQYGAYVLLGDASIWSGEGPLVASGWLGLKWVSPAQVVDGKFTTTIKVPAGTFDASKEYVVATSAAHGLSVTDRTLDTFTPLTFKPVVPVADPKVTVTPSADLDPAVENVFTISGTGFVGAGAQYGAYVLLGDASIWKGDAPLVADGWLGLQWVMPAQVVDGKFTTTIKVPAGSFDPATEYVVATSAAHGLSVTDRSLDTFTALSVKQPGKDAEATSTTLRASSASIVEGTDVAFTATVAPASAEGVVRFVDGSKDLGSAAVKDGVAVFAASDLAVGPHSVTAVFTPTDSTSFLTSTSEAATVTVTAKPVTPPPAGAAGSLQWGVKESFRTYIAGPIAQGGVTTSNGATGAATGLYSFPQSATSSFDTASRKGTVDFAGTVRFTGHGGILDVRLSNPRVVATGDKATLVADVDSKDIEGGSFVQSGVTVATLDLAAAKVTTGNGTTTYASVPAALTAAGVPAFGAFYTAGDALDPVTFTVGSAVENPGTTPGESSGNTDGSGTQQDPAKATLSVSQAAPGDQVTISGIGFGANEAGLRVEVHSTPQVLATGITANAGGAATSTVTIPKDLPAGEHTLLLIGANHTASAAITVTGSSTSGSGSAAQQCYAQGVNGATLTWAVSDKFRAYIAGPIAKGAVSASGAKDNGSTTTWSGGKGSFNTDLGKGRASFAGSVHFTGHGGILDLQISNPRVQVNGGSGTLVVDVVSSDMEGNKSTSKGVAFANLDLSGKKATSGTTITWTGAPATLTAAGAKAFAGFYEAGTALAPVTFSFPIGGDVECDTFSGLAATGSDAGNATALAVMLLLSGAGLLAVSKRRRARATA